MEGGNEGRGNRPSDAVTRRARTLADNIENAALRGDESEGAVSSVQDSDRPAPAEPLEDGGQRVAYAHFKYNELLRADPPMSPTEAREAVIREFSLNRDLVQGFDNMLNDRHTTEDAPVPVAPSQSSVTTDNTDAKQEARRRRTVAEGVLKSRFGRYKKIEGARDSYWTDADENVFMIRGNGDVWKIPKGQTINLGRGDAPNWKKWNGDTEGWSDASQEDISAAPRRRTPIDIETVGTAPLITTDPVAPIPDPAAPSAAPAIPAAPDPAAAVPAALAAPRAAPRGPAAAPAAPAAPVIPAEPGAPTTLTGAPLQPVWAGEQFAGSKINKWYKWFSPSGVADKLNMRKALKSETNLRRKHGEGWRETEDGKKLVSWMHAAFPGLYGSSAPAATVDATKMTRDQMRSYLKEEPRATERAMRDLKNGIIAEGEQLGHAQRLMRISEDIKRRFPLWKRVAIGAGLVGAGALGAAFSPALASITALSAFAWRAGSSIAAGVTTTAAAYSYLEKRNSKHPMVYSVLAGTLAGATAFNSTYIFEKLSELVQGKIQWNPFASATPTPFMSDPVPPPGLATPDLPKVGGLPAELQPRTIVPGVEVDQEPHINTPPPIADAPPASETPMPRPGMPVVPDAIVPDVPPPTPEPTPVIPTPMSPNLIDITSDNVGMLRRGLDSLVDAKISEAVDVFGFNTDEMHQFKDALRRTLVKFPDLAQQLTGSGVNPITAQGNIIFQDSGRIDLSVFGNQKFLDGFKEIVAARERTYLMPKLNSMGGVDALVDMLKSQYGR